jgi:type I restriction enzyme, S subunit
MTLPETWVEARIGDVLTRVETRVDPRLSHTDSMFYVGLEHIESHTGRMLREADEFTEAADILSIKTAFKAGDILYGKLRPNLNKVHLAVQDGICSTDIWALRTSDVLMPEFALHYMRSPAVHVRASQMAAGANLPRVSPEAFDRIAILLPTLLEQQRIVDVLKQAEAAAPDQQSRRKQLSQLIQAALDRLVLPIDPTAWEPLGKFATTRYGTSVSADATAESGTRVLRIPNVMGGEVDTTDMKYVELTRGELDRLSLTNSDVLIVRSNGNPEYVGRSAPITEEVAQAETVYASYLIRLRADTTRLLPEYLSAFLNSAYGRAAMRNVIRTTAGQSNLSGENLSKLKLPVPPMEEQRRFKQFWLSVQALRRLMVRSEDLASELRNALSMLAMSGELTAEWREHHTSEIIEAASKRDTLLRQIGTKHSTTGSEAAHFRATELVSDRLARHWLQAELSEFQRQVLAAFIAYSQQSGRPLLAEDPDVFASFCDDAAVAKRLRPFGTALNNRIRRTLSQLAALGLIAKVTLPGEHPETKSIEYLKAFRLVQSKEFTKQDDIDAIRRATLTFRFSVEVDYETSQRAGATGKFQVVDLLDEKGKSRADLVDQGKHYGTLDELASDLARSLRVVPNQIVLEE